MNKNTKNAVIAGVVLVIIIVGIWFATNSKESAVLDTNTLTASSTEMLVENTPAGSQIDDGQTRDKNGCISSANFVWDKKIGSCVHVSKVSTSTTDAMVNKSATNTLSNAMAQNLCSSAGGQWSEKVRECLGVNNNVCESIGGEFAECASPCRNDPNAQVCTMMCVQVCSIK